MSLHSLCCVRQCQNFRVRCVVVTSLIVCAPLDTLSATFVLQVGTQMSQQTMQSIDSHQVQHGGLVHTLQKNVGSVSLYSTKTIALQEVSISWLRLHDMLLLCIADVYADCHLTSTRLQILHGSCIASVFPHLYRLHQQQLRSQPQGSTQIAPAHCNRLLALSSQRTSLRSVATT